MALQNVRSSTADKRPNPASLSDGQLAINTAASTTGLFYKNASGALVKAGPVYIGTTAPNATPAAGGHAGNSVGETWLDTAGANPILKVWDGSTWRVVQPVTSGTVVSTADTGTVTSTMIANGTIVDADVNASAAIAGTKISPSFGAQNITTTGTSTAASYNPTSSTVPTNGIYLPAANSVGISTNGAGRLFVDASGRVGVGTSSSSARLTINGDAASTSHGIHLLRNGYTALGRFGFQSATGSELWLTNNYNPTSGAADSGEGGSLCFASNSETRFVTGNSERLRITNAGLVGIGTSAPSGTFHVRASHTLSAGSQVALIENTAVGEPVSLAFSAVADNTGAGNQGAIYFDAGASGTATDNKLQFTALHQDTITPAMTLDGSGRLGIGTTAPLYLIDGRAGADGNVMLLRGGSTRQLTFGTNSTSPFINSDNGGGLELQVNGAQRALIDTSGRLLVGTSTAVAGAFSLNAREQLHGTAADFSTKGIFRWSADIGNPALNLCKSRGASVGTRGVVVNGDTLGYLSFEGDDGTNFIRAAGIFAQVDGTPGANDMPGRLVFSTTADGASSPTERMRINSSGAQQAYSANDVYRAASGQAAGTNFGFYYGYHSATTTQNGTLVYLVYTNGNVANANNSYGAISDIKLKENIVDANSQWDDLKALQIRKYNFKEGQTHTQIGLIAQEVELVSPGLVSESPDRDAEGNDLGTVTKSVNYSVLYMKAVKALQEAMERIETLEAKVAALEAQ